MRALAVCTNHGAFPSKSAGTGLWFGELAHFYEVLSRRRIRVDIASPLGGHIPLDERSLESKDETVRKYCEDISFREKLDHSIALGDVDADRYRVVFLAGGHGAMWDFPGNPVLQRIVREVYESYGTVTAVGHGVSGLLNVTLSDGTSLVDGKYVTGFSNMEEKLVSFVSEVPFYLEDLLVAQGAHFTKAMIPYTEHIELDDRLITGQNPNSAHKLATKLIEELTEK